MTCLSNNSWNYSKQASQVSNWTRHPCAFTWYISPFVHPTSYSKYPEYLTGRQTAYKLVVLYCQQLEARKNCASESFQPISVRFYTGKSCPAVHSYYLTLKSVGERKNLAVVPYAGNDSKTYVMFDKVSGEKSQGNGLSCAFFCSLHRTTTSEKKKGDSLSYTAL